ncbi:MAG: helix-turn-helix domain-containing protein [Planctomycetaceae bacterium]|nr:helix-turn-helix domain-containing protein [Planctomycetota bacterium]NUN51421.1 helix-turn-helix domain-containing protein [Planctomycetaceae bacterium]
MRPSDALPAEASEPRRHLLPGDLLSVAQALELLPVGRATLYRLLAEQAIPSIRVATLGSRRGRVLIVRGGLERFVASLLGPPEERRVSPRPLDVNALRDRIVGAGAVRARLEAR